MIPNRFESVLFGVVLSGLMSIIVSGVSTTVARGLGPGFASAWAISWIGGWLLAFPIVLVLGPVTRKIVRFLMTGRSSDSSDPV